MSIVTSHKQAESDAAALHIAARNIKLDGVKAELVAKGEVAEFSRAEVCVQPLPGAPQLVFDLEISCHKNGCGTPLEALGYHAFINDPSPVAQGGADNQTPRFMLWIEGMCPKCMESRRTIFDPMAGLQAKAKQTAEMDKLWEQWKAELMPADDDAAPVKESAA
jgi:hypothetical protein